ncbi:MAG: energy-coupling factor transporter ATPase [Ruminococcaceae bacterium]|nr:energy-coupling factor transporter ATPase [Oscillospiraceae bacterium]
MIKIEHLNYIYQPGMPGEHQALSDINLTIADGSFTALIGHTGSGKSTLIQHLNALIRPTSGEILVNGVSLCDAKTDLKTIRRMVGLVFQYPEHQLFEETVYKDIAFGPTNMGLSPDEVKSRVYEAIELVGISEDLLEKSPFELSGGQKRRVAIAGVLSMRPSVLILDEPTAGLDPHGRDKLLSRLVHLHQSSPDMTILFVSHSMEDVARIAEQVIVMNRGTVFMQGTVPEVFAHAQELQKIGLNVPQITILFEKLRQSGAKLPTDIYTVSAAAEYLISRLGGKTDA